MAAFISLERKPSSVAAGDQEEQIVFTDDETTVEGFDFDGFDLHIFGIEDYEEYFEYRNPAIELKCDSDRACARKRRRLFRTLFAVLLAIVAISFGALVPWLWKTEHLKTESHLKVENQSESTRSIACSNGHNLKIASWLGQNKSDSASICEPTFYPSKQTADINKPVKVFILMGEANMLGSGQIKGHVDGTLEYAIEKKRRFHHLIDSKGEWTTRSDVRYVGVNEQFHVHKNEWLTVHDEQTHFGPELQFGYIMGELLDSPVMVLKSCAGHRSLGGDMLPPGSSAFRSGDFEYAGYGDSPHRWPFGIKPESTEWHAGIEYDVDVSNAKQVLMNIGHYYPGATKYEISGFVWWQGDTDRRMPAYAERYEENLVQLIKSLRSDFNTPDASFTIATIGQDGNEMKGESLMVAEAQLAVSSSKYPEFSGNVRTVDIRPSWRGAHQPGFEEGDKEHQDPSHYGNNAETLMEVGNALGWAMANLLQIS